MGYIQQIGLPVAEPVSLAQMKTHLRLASSYTAEDSNILGFIQGAREEAEAASGLCLAQRQFEQVLDSFPYFTDTIQSQLAYPPSFYSLPRYSTTLWNYSQMIKLQQAPAVSVDLLTYVGTDGNEHTLVSGSDFIFDPMTKLPRIFPMVGQYWPACLYTPNAVLIKFTAGYSPDPAAVVTIGLPSPTPVPTNQQDSYTISIGILQRFVTGIMNLVAFDFQNRGGGDMAMREKIVDTFRGGGIMDFSGTRG